jgi:opacity protein-like surface antigen
MAIWAMCVGCFLAHLPGPSVAHAADLYVSGALLNSFTTGTGTGDIFLGGTTPLFTIDGKDKDSSPAFGGTLGFGFGVDELRADVRGFEMPHWKVRLELEGIFGREFDFRFDTQSVGGGGGGGVSNTFFSEIDAWTVMTNVWVDVPVQRPISYLFGRVPILNPLSIYAGGGMGLARAEFQTTDNISKGNEEINRFSWQAGAGIGYKLNQWATLNIGYRYWDLGKVDAKVLFGDNTLTGRQQVDLTSQEFVTNIRIAFYQAPLEEMAPRKWDWPHWEGPRWWQRSKRRMSRWQLRRPRWLGGAGF